MDMKTELINTITVGEGVCLIFKNGKEITGVVQAYDDELMAVVLADGQRKLISYSLIGYFEKADIEVSANPSFTGGSNAGAADGNRAAGGNKAAGRPLSDTAAGGMPVKEAAGITPDRRNDAAFKQRPAAENAARESANEETGLIQYYYPAGKYGIIRSSKGGTIQFLLRNVDDAGLAEMLETQGSYKGKLVAYTIIPYVDKRGIKKNGAAQVRSIGSDKPEAGINDILRKANNLFSSGKSNDEEALKLYLKVFESGNHREVAARNIVSIYMRSGQPQEAEDFLIKHKEYFGEEQFYTFLYQIYMQLDDADKAASTADSIIAITSRPTSRLHYLLQKAKIYFRNERFKEAADVCEQWLNYKHSSERELQGQTVSLEYSQKQICVLAARCIVWLKETDPCYEPSRKLLDYISNDDDAQELLSLDAGDEDTDSINYGDYRNYISPIAQKLLDECVLSECGVDNRKLSPGEGKYTGSLREAKAQAASLMKASTTQKPFVRYRNCLGAARVIYDALSNKESMTEMQDVVMETELEDMFFGSLAKALVSLGDDMIGRNDVELDVARYYYLESLKYSRVDEQDKQNAITRCVLSLFTDRAQIPLTMQRDTDNLSVQQDLARYLNKTDQLEPDRLIYTITRIINSALSNQTKRILGQLTSGVLKSNRAKQLFHTAKAILDQDGGSSSSVDGFEDVILKLHSKYKKAEKDFLHIVERLKGITFAPLWLQELHDDIQQFTSFFSFMDDLDQKRCRVITSLLARAREYNLFESFGLKENCLRSILSQLDELEASITELPAKYSYEYLLPAVRNWRTVTAGVLNELYLSRKPKINCQIIENDGLHLYDGDCVYVHIYITNESDRQTADSLTVKLPDKEEYTVMSHLERRYYIKEGDAQTIRVRLKLNDPDIKAFSVDTLVEYEYKITENETERKTEKFENSVILGDFTFTELENPYFAYVSSGIVDKEEMVFGRADFIDGIITALKGDGITPLRRKTIALYGQKRTGKSTVLYHLEKRIRKEISTTVVVSLGDISKWRAKNFETRLYREMFKSIGTELARNHTGLLDAMNAKGIKVPDYNEIDDEDKGREMVSDFFTAFNDLISENAAFSRYNVVILLDEFTNIYIGLCKNKIDADFMKYWKAIINDFGLVAIVVGQDYMMDFVNAYPNPFGAIDKRPLSYLPLNEAERMIVRPPVSDESKRAVFDGPSGERAVKKILELTAGSAFFIMILMDRLIGYLNEVKQPYVTDADIDRLVADNLLSGHYSLDLAKFESLYYDDGDVSDVSRPRHNVAVLWTISKQLHDFSRCRRSDILISDKIASHSEMPKERVDELLARLVARDVLNVDRDGNYTIKVGLFNEWLYHNCSVDTINSIPDVK